MNYDIYRPTISEIETVRAFGEDATTKLSLGIMSREVTRVHEDSYAIYLLFNLFDFWIPSFENLEGYVTVVKHTVVFLMGKYYYRLL